MGGRCAAMVAAEGLHCTEVAAEGLRWIGGGHGMQCVATVATEGLQCTGGSQGLRCASVVAAAGLQCIRGWPGMHRVAVVAAEWLHCTGGSWGLRCIGGSQGMPPAAMVATEGLHCTGVGQGLRCAAVLAAEGCAVLQCWRLKAVAEVVSVGKFNRDLKTPGCALAGAMITRWALASPMRF